MKLFIRDQLNHNHWKIRFINGEMMYLEILEGDFDEVEGIEKS